MSFPIASAAVFCARSATVLVFAAILAACQSVPGKWARDEWLQLSNLLGPKSAPEFASKPEPIHGDMFPLPSPEEDVVGQIQIITAHHEDTLPDLARRFDLGYDEITLANPGVDAWLPGEGTPVVLPTQFVLPDAPRKGIVLNVATMRLFYFPPPKPNEPPVVITHPIGIGRVNWSTPLGKAKIVSKQANPAWYVPASIRAEHAKAGDPLPAVVPAGPNNPLGAYAMRLSIPGYLIHGTNKPYGVGMRVSHGCIRLYPEDIKALFKQVPVGTPVKIVNQPFLAGWSNGMLYLESHEPLEEYAKIPGLSVETLVQAIDQEIDQTEDTVDWIKAATLAKAPPGLPVPILQGSPGLKDVLAAALRVENVPQTPSVADSKSVTPSAEPVAERDSRDVTTYVRQSGRKYPAFVE